MKQKLLIPLLLASVIAVAQELETLTVTGKVSAFLEKQPLAGVNVIIKGTTRGVITDMNGDFSIEANTDDVLVFSFIGYDSKEVPVNGQSTINVALEEGLAMLQEIAVYSTGYEDIPKERATGSFVQLDNQLVNRRVSTDVLSRLEDVTSGLVFNRNGTTTDPISIRGRSTLFANAQPLIVIDNFPYDGDLDNINPNDVESITVLKDAAAASIWGARAGNGVIVITTKKGGYGEQVKVGFNSNVTVEEMPDPFYVSQMTSADYIETEKVLFAQNFFRGQENSSSKPALSPVVEILIAQRDGLITPDEANAQMDALKQNDMRHDFEKYLYRNSINQQYALSLSGGSADQRYVLSAGYDKNLSAAVGDDYGRLTLNAQNTWKLLKEKLEVSTGLYITSTESHDNALTPSGIRMNATTMYPYARLADEQGDHLAINKGYRNRFIDQSEADGLLDWNYVPLDEMRFSDKGRRMVDYRINTGLRYKIAEGLYADARYQYWKTNEDDRRHFSTETYFTRDLINQFTQVSATDELTQAIPPGGILDLINENATSHNGRGQISYSRKWRDVHAVHALAGGEIKQVLASSNTHRYYGYDDELAASAPVDYNSFFQRYHNQNLRAKIPYTDAHRELTDRFISYYANAAYTFRGRYTISASARKDQSNLFGVRANQRGVPLWSAGAAWTVSDESFYPFAFMPYLKLRATYGHSGNIDKTVSAFTTARVSTTSMLTRLPYAYIINPPNPELRWEKVSVTNVALDFELRNRVVHGSVEYFVKDGKDLIGDTPFPPSTGVQLFRGNVASTRNRGVDVTLHSRNVDRAIQWHTDVLFSYVKEEVTDYEVDASPVQYLAYGTGLGNIPPYPMEGRPMFALYSYQWAGLDPETGDPQGYLEGHVSKDYAAIINTATPETLQYHGPARPTTFGALRNTISWKGFSLSVNVSYRLGYYLRRPSIRYSNNKGLGGHGDYSLRWQQPGDQTQVPSIPSATNTRRDDFYTYADVLVEKGDHIRLQDANLSYTISNHGKLPVERVQVYVYANNLGLIWKSSDAIKDPDYIYSKSLRTVAMGLKVDF